MTHPSLYSSGVAPSVGERPCAKCSVVKPLDDFHKQPTGKNGRHSWCKVCCNEYYRINRKRNYSPEQKRRWQLSTRYGLTPTQVDEMVKAQDGKCAICTKDTPLLVVDHCHTNGTIRGMLCHACNIKLPVLERKEWMERALQYLSIYEIR